MIKKLTSSVSRALLEGSQDTVGGPGSTVVAQTVLDALDHVHQRLGDLDIGTDVAGLDGALVQGLGDAVGVPAAGVLAKAVRDLGLDVADDTG